MKSKSPDMIEIYKEFHREMDKPGFRPLIRAAGKIFDAPVVFTDNEYQMVSMYPTKKIDDFVYDTLLETGGLPEETIAAFHKAYLSQPGKRYDPFFEKEGLVKDCPRIFAEVYDETKVLGHVAIFLKDREFEPWQLDATSILTQVLRIKINLSNRMPSVNSDTLQYLMNRNTTKHAKTRAIAQLSKFDLKDAALLVAPLDQTKSQHAFASVAINYFLHRFPCVIPTIYNDDLVVLISAEGANVELGATAEKISDYLYQYHIISGAVDPVEDLYSLPDYYLQGRLTALYRYRNEMEGSNTKLYYYHDIAPIPLFLHLSQQKEYHCFIHPVLGKIQEYDKENDTDYYKTLSSYCRHLFQKNDTSEAMHIHRNTLNYRLSRLEELFGLDLQDYHVLLHLVLSLEISAYSNN
ncbi:helix-turn-helix domain-containing protein [Alkalibacter sp. M17DMB]|nr:helix-turn-helix domain-containing protein [Alkalibacter mobilis]